jgi:peptide methionine sulfoxide reductase MsrA
VYGVSSGLSGGEETNPSYEDVKRQLTGHRETIRVTYDPEKVGFDTLLAVFLANVDPFDGGGQFIDRGGSYTLLELRAAFGTAEDSYLGVLRELIDRHEVPNYRQ